MVLPPHSLKQLEAVRIFIGRSRILLGSFFGGNAEKRAFDFAPGGYSTYNTVHIITLVLHDQMSMTHDCIMYNIDQREEHSPSEGELDCGLQIQLVL